MQLSILFALLPLIANAAPLNIGIPGVVQVSIPVGGNTPNLPTPSGVKVPTISTPALPSALKPLVPVVSGAASIAGGLQQINPSGIVAGLQVGAGAGASIVSAAANVIPSAVPTVLSAVGAGLPTPVAKLLASAAQGTGAPDIKATANAAVSAVASIGAGGISAAANNQLFSISINSALLQATGTLGGVVAPITTGTPTDVFKKLNTYITGIKPIDTVGLVNELGSVAAELETDLKLYLQNIKDNVEYKSTLIYLATLVKNLNTFLVTLPAELTSNASVVAAAANIDNLLAMYLQSFQTAGLATTDFLSALYLTGLTSAVAVSSLLTKFAAIFPPLPTFTAGL